MIYVIYGKIGGGKTYTAIKEFILPALKQGRTVYTNIDFGYSFDFVAEANFSQFLGMDLRGKINIISNTEKFMELFVLNDLDGLSLRVEKNSLIVVDEAQMIFDYLNVNRIDKRVYNFFAYVRHFGVDIVFITQSPDLLNKFIIGLANEFWEVYNLRSNTRFLSGRYRIDVKQYLHQHTPTFSYLKKFDSDIFRLYRSYISPPVEILRFLPVGFARVAVVFGIFLFLVVYVLFFSKGRFLFF